jgi:hypothetical protein
MSPTPEHHYFDDPQMDRMLGIVMTLAGELYVTRQRLSRLTALLEEGGNVAAGALDVPLSDELEAAVRSDGEPYLERLFRALAEQGSQEAPLRSEWLDAIRQS